MTETIQRQQLRLHFGDKFDEEWARTRSYVKSLISKRAWWVNQRQLIDNEGPLSRMVEHCMMYIVEAGDRKSGRQAYTSYLAGEYGTSQARFQNEIDLPEYSPAYSVPDDFVSQTPIERKVQKIKDTLKLSDNERDFLIAGHRMGVRHAGEAFGMSKDEAWKEWRRLKAYIKYQVDPEYRERRKEYSKSRS